MVEAEKLKAAGEAYKHDMLQKKVMDLEAELEATRRAAKREASSESVHSISCLSEIAIIRVKGEHCLLPLQVSIVDDTLFHRSWP